MSYIASNNNLRVKALIDLLNTECYKVGVVVIGVEHIADLNRNGQKDVNECQTNLRMSNFAAIITPLMAYS